MRGSVRIDKQGHQRSSKRFHLSFSLRTRSPCIWIEQCPQSGVLCGQTVILGDKDCYLLLGKASSRLGVVSLLLPDLHPVAPKTGSNGFVTHGQLPAQ
jgi:hypothetical protein